MFLKIFVMEVCYTAFCTDFLVKGSRKCLREKKYFYRAPEHGLLPKRLPGAREQLRGEDFMGYGDNVAYFTRKRTSDILLRNHNAVCNNLTVLLVNWRGENSWIWC